MPTFIGRVPNIRSGALTHGALGRHAVQILRVHDVEEARDAITVYEAIGRHGGG